MKLTKRIQFTPTPAVNHMLRRQAKRTGRSMSSLIRECVDTHLTNKFYRKP
jgi:hypothetical protein